MQQIKFLVSVLLTLPLFCFGQYKNIDLSRLKRCSVKTINFEQGLMNNETGSIITDIRGFTWVSTKIGIQRFNGYAMENINPVADHDTIVIDYPVIFFPLKNGNIWISYDRGILEYNPFKNTFHKTIDIGTAPKKFLSVIPLLQKTEGIWCMYAGKGIAVYNEDKKISQPFSKSETVFVDSLLQGAAYLSVNIAATNGKDIFLSDSKHVLHINTAAATADYLPQYFSYIFSLQCNNDKLFVTSDKGLFTININDRLVSKIVPYKQISNESVFTTQVYLVNGQLLLSINRHLYELDTACVYQKEFTSLNGDPILTTGHIHFIYADKFKRIWLMSNDDIKVIQNVEIPFAHYIYPGAKSNFVKCIYFDEQKKLLLAGCFDGGIQLYDTSGNHLWDKPIISDAVKDIMNIEKLTQDDYLIETYFRGMFILNLPSKKISPLPVTASIKNILHPDMVNWTNNCLRVNDSVIFITTKNNLYDCTFKNTVLKSARPLLPFFPNTKDQYNCFVYTSDKAIWMGTSFGTMTVLDKSGNIKNVNPPGNYGIRCCIEDAKHHIWIGTDKGLYVYNESGLLIKTISRASGLLNDCIYALLPVDNKAAVFTSTNYGLSYVPLDGNIKNYSKELGLQGNEFNNGAACKTSGGKFYFGGVNGITGFYPASLSTVKDTPVINITRLTVNDSLYNVQSVSENGDTISLNYNQNQIQLDIAANGLLNTDEYIYTYRLKGLEASWQTTHRPTAIRYTLDPGTYTLEINCSPYLSSNTVFNKNIVIIIHPPWWRTWWFRLLAGIAVAFFIALIVWQYSRRRYLKKIRVLQLQQQIQQERERISRDLHDNLGAYVAAIAANVTRVQEINENHEPEASQALNELQTNSQSIIAQLHDTIWALNRKEITLTAISDKFKIFLQKVAPTYQDIDMSVKESIVDDIALSPVNALHLFRIMQEAVNNAVRHSNCHNIIVSIESNITWSVTIKDDGSGIATTTNTDSGNGLRNMRQRAQEAGWELQWVDQNPNGTKISIYPKLSS
ncbi:MAG: histidine kinase [Ferruginibacter sp.]